MSSATIAKASAPENAGTITTIDLVRKITNAPRAALVVTNKPTPKPEEPPAPPEPEWTPVLTAYVAPKDPNNLWPIFLVILLTVLTTELIRRHRRRRKRRFIPTLG
jgi:hypothetical protein